LAPRPNYDNTKQSELVNYEDILWRYNISVHRYDTAVCLLIGKSITSIHHVPIAIIILTRYLFMVQWLQSLLLRLLKKYAKSPKKGYRFFNQLTNCTSLMFRLLCILWYSRMTTYYYTLLNIVDRTHNT
jgi:hypothetical protein